MRIERRKNGNHFSYRCFDKQKKLVFTYIVDWNKNEFVFIDNANLTSENIFNFGKNKQLYETVNHKGLFKKVKGIIDE